MAEKEELVPEKQSLVSPLQGTSIRMSANSILQIVDTHTAMLQLQITALQRENGHIGANGS